MDNNAPVSKRFSSSDSDVTIRSSNGVLFKVHRINLEMHSGAFPGVEIPTNDEIVSLSESSDVLELLFQYMYKQRQPELDDLQFSVVSALAEAVEKYEVFPAMQICKAYMKNSISDHPLEVLHYAARHKHFALCDAAAPLTLTLLSKEVSKVLTDSTTFRAWVLFRDEHLPDVFKNCRSCRRNDKKTTVSFSHILSPTITRLDILEMIRARTSTVSEGRMPLYSDTD